jgi:L-iditol 2-dehydrogenase
MALKREMNAWVKKDGVHGLFPTKLAIPRTRPHELLLKVKAVGICGTDIGIYAGKRKVPDGLIPGHEFCGEVIEIGESVRGFHAGELVTPGIIVNCGTCKPCRSGFEAQCENLLEYGIHIHGAFAEYIAVDAKTVHKLPGGFSPIKGASIEPVAVAYNVVKKIGGVCLNRTALVYGPGPIGLYTTQLLLGMGFKHVIVVGLVENRLRVARHLGARTINARKEDVADCFKAIAGGPGADVIVEATGNPEVLKGCFKLLSPHGTLVVAGIFHETAGVDLLSVVRNENTIVGSFCYTYDDYAHAAELVVDGKINFDPMISHVLPLTDLDQGFSLAIEEKAIKVVFEL